MGAGQEKGREEGEHPGSRETPPNSTIGPEVEGAGYR